MFKLFTHFHFFQCWVLRISPDILNTNSLSIWFANIVREYKPCYNLLHCIFLKSNIFLKFSRNLTYQCLSFMDHIFGVFSKKSLPNPRSQRSLPCVFLGKCRILDFTFWSIHFVRFIHMVHSADCTLILCVDVHGSS